MTPYDQLRREITAAGLLNRTRIDYAWRTGLAFALLAGGFALSGPAPVLAAVILAFACIQVALIGHDAGHLAVFTTRRANAALGEVCWTAALGISFAYWTDRHNRHHARTNDSAHDPDMRWDAGPLLTPFMAFSFRVEGWRFAVRHRLAGELIVLTFSTLAWLTPALALGWIWLPILLASQVLASLYLAGVVAPNHIGMPTWAPGAAPTFLEQQVRSSRNVSPGLLADYVFGGLNYQIEHHLFPTMPRGRFAAARALVKPFCAEHGLPYTESDVIHVYRTVLAELPRLRSGELV